MVERELLRDHPTHRDAHHVRAFDFGMVEHAGRVGGHVGHRKWLFGLVALAGAAVIDHDDLEARFEQPKEGFAPSAARPGVAEDERERLALAANFVMDPYSVPALSECSCGHLASPRECEICAQAEGAARNRAHGGRRPPARSDTSAGTEGTQ